jgi:glycosyltransferase involved in cell wall biosynthesis
LIARILFVANPASIHTARWISQLDGVGWDVRVLGSAPTVVNDALKGATVYGFSGYRPPRLSPSTRVRGLWPLRRGAWHLGAPLRPLFPQALRTLLRTFKPDVVHALGIQHAGYLTMQAMRRMSGRRPPLIVSNFGSDIYYYRRFDQHVRSIQEVMENADYLVAECERDLLLGRDYGFAGEPFAIVPCAGGFDLEQMRGLRTTGPPSKRKTIMVKGVQGEHGRALVALQALDLCGESLKGYRIVFTRAGSDVVAEAKRLAARHGLEIVIQSGTREDVLRWHGSSRLFIGLAVSEGANTSMLEAIAMGSFPIQSCTACADEWVMEGKSGLIVPPEDPEAVAAAIRRALVDDGLVDHAAELNERAASERLDERVVRPLVVNRYSQILQTAGAHTAGSDDR